LIRGEKEPLLLRECEDHDIILGKSFEVLQAFGYLHPKGGCYAIEKYKLTNIETPWKKGSSYFKRLFREYTFDALGKPITLMYDASMRSLFPYIDLLSIREILKPEVGLKRLLNSVRDELELTALELYDSLRSAGIHPSSIGVTGSLLVGMHNRFTSDIDMTVRGARNITILFDISVLSPLQGKKLENWVKNNSERLGVPEHSVLEMYEKKKRGLFKGKTVSIIPLISREEAGNYQIISGDPLGVATLIIELSQPSYLSYVYPSEHRFKVLSLIEGSELIRKNMYGKIISYEGLFSNALVKAGKAIVSGKVFLSKEEEFINVVIGTRESKSSVKILKR
jgi:predicted nucleotidyltransferase